MKKCHCITQFWSSFMEESVLWKLFFVLLCLVIVVFTLPITYAFIVPNFFDQPVFTTAGIIIALLSASILYFFGRRMMRHTDYSRGVLGFGLLWGIGAIALNSYIIYLLPESLDTIKATPVFGGIMEEISKAVFLFGLAVVGRKYFTSIMSGVVMGWFVGMGFSFLENVSYYSSILQDGEYIGVAVRFITGAITGDHALYTGLVGGGIGCLLHRFRPVNLVWIFPLAVFPSALLHAINNGLLGDVCVFVMMPVKVIILGLLLTKGCSVQKDRSLVSASSLKTDSRE